MQLGTGPSPGHGGQYHRSIGSVQLGTGLLLISESGVTLEDRRLGERRGVPFLPLAGVAFSTVLGVSSGLSSLSEHLLTSSSVCAGFREKKAAWSERVCVCGGGGKRRSCHYGADMAIKD